MTDIIDRIDEALSCQHCGHGLKPDGPSIDFCGESCQKAWAASRAAKQWPASDKVDRASGPAWGQGAGVGLAATWAVRRPSSAELAEVARDVADTEPASLTLDRGPVPIDDRVAAVERLAAMEGFTLTGWQRDILRAIYSGEQVIWPRRGGRATITALVQREVAQRGGRGPDCEQLIGDALDQRAAEYAAAEEGRPGWLSRLLGRWNR